MSLLDDVSIVVTPNGYKAGRLYGVLPTAVEGSEEVTNGNFATDTDWTKGTGWTISGGKANSDGTQSVSYLRQNGIVNLTSTYKVQFTVSGSTSGTLNFLQGNGSTAINITSNNTYNYFVNWDGSTGDIVFQSLNFVGAVDNVSVKQFTASDMDVTRATAATRVDENGLVNYAEVLGSELITNGDFATDSDWNKGTGITIGSGVALFTSVSSGSQLSQSSTSVVSGKTYKISYEIKTRTEGAFSASIGGALSLNQNSAVGVYTEYLTATGAGIFYIRSRGTTSGSIDNISVKEADLNNVPRIDYTGGGCPHILAEPQRTNLVTYSEDLSVLSKVSVGTASAPVTTSNYATAPDGTQTATRVVFNLNGGTSSGDRSILRQAIPLGSDYYFSIYVKSTDGTEQKILWHDGGEYNLTTVTNEWVRITYDGRTNLTYAGIALRGGEGVDSSDILTWGFQVETGSYPTSYIPTSGSTVTRNQDIFTRDGIGSLINSTEGCVFGEGNFAESNSSSYNYFVSLSDGTPNNRLEIRQSGSNLQFLWRVATYQSEISTSSLDVSGNFKFALNYSAANIKFYVNGNLIGTINTPTLWSANTLNRLAFDNGAGGDRLSGKVKQLQVYDTALTDEQLLQLTGESGTDFYESYAEMASALTYTIQ